MASITDVARLAGVSITTASRVLNPVAGYPIAAPTRQRVLAAAEAVQYSPSAIARALVTRRSRIVGAIVGDIVDPYFAEIVRGVEDVARRAGYMVVVCNTDRDPATERRYVATLRDYRADAILFLGGDFHDEEGRRQLEQEIALARRNGTVAMALAGERGDLPTVDVDHRAGAREMAEYLIELGHRRIGFIAGPGVVQTAQLRLSGFRDAAAAAGVESSLVAEGGFTYAGGQAAAARLLACRPTALFAANDEMGIGALAAVREARLRVPDDVTVVGFGDTARARQSVPALTSVSMPRQEMGAVAMEAVLAALGPAKGSVESRIVAHHLVVRGSAGPPARHGELNGRARIATAS
ncbi:MAG TPA: LacI family DNA-binding transcriptional regulator [Chloroflexota bacterium]|nr:LacI family DNA-binding transcriptional regulator [Chloroflexota bacterium]